MRAVMIIRAVVPGAKPEYLDAFDAGEGALAAAGIGSPLRLAHFLAQVLHETGGLTILRESGTYSAARISEVFGIGQHSAAVSPVEARQLAGNGAALFERVYGLGNPRMAAQLGNTRPGDGWAYRGNGLLQTTGRGQHREMGERSGVGDLFERAPSRVTSAEHALKPALAEWARGDCNALADKGDIRQITRTINGGFNGYAERVAWLDKVWAVLRPGAVPAWKAAGPDAAVRDLQGKLAILGYTLAADGLYGPGTQAAVRDFQARCGLKADGIAGPITLSALEERLRPVKAERLAA